MNVKAISLSAILFSFVLTACQKEDNPPVINVTQPASGTVLEAGKSYAFEATVTDDNGLVEINFGSNKITNFDTPTSHTVKNATITVPANATSGSQVTISISAKDNGGHTTTVTPSYSVK